MTSFYGYARNPLANTPPFGGPRRGNGGSDQIDVDEERLYEDYEIDVQRETAENLAGVVAGQVRPVATTPYRGATDDAGAGPGLRVTDLSLRPRLQPSYKIHVHPCHGCNSP